MGPWVALLGVLAASTPGSGGADWLLPCSEKDDGVSAPARCGTFEVPENWEEPRVRRVGLRVVVIPAARPRTGAAPLFELAGGPGIGATGGAAEFFSEALAAFREHRDVVLVDQRGTGRSAPLRCAELEAQGPLDEMYPPDLVRACRDRLAVRADLTQYTTANAARDLDAVRAALGHPKVDLSGLSYGTVLGLTYLKLFPERVRSAVLAGAADPAAKMPLGHAAAAQAALEAVFARCDVDGPCRVAFPNLRKEWEAVLARLEAAPVRARRETQAGPVEVEIRRDVFGEAFRGILGFRAWDVPFVVHRMAQGDFTPFLDRLSFGGTSPFAEGLYLSVVCAEGTWRITEAEAAEAARGAFLGDYRVSQQRRACALWPHARTDPARLEAPRSTVPVLFLNGTADYVTPPAIARSLALRLPGSRLVLIENLLHLPSGVEPMACYDRIVNAFFADPDPARLDLGCLASMKATPFRTGPETP